MTMAALIILAAVIGSLLTVIVVLVRMQSQERESWTLERTDLVNRIIARHIGEVVAMDNASRPRAPRPETERPQAVGM